MGVLSDAIHDTHKKLCSCQRLRITNPTMTTCLQVPSENICSCSSAGMPAASSSLFVKTLLEAITYYNLARSYNLKAELVGQEHFGFRRPGYWSCHGCVGCVCCAYEPASTTSAAVCIGFPQPSDAWEVVEPCGSRCRLDVWVLAVPPASIAAQPCVVSQVPEYHPFCMLKDQAYQSIRQLECLCQQQHCCIHKEDIDVVLV